MSKYGLLGKFTVNESEREMLIEILLEAQQAMEQLEECEMYHVHTSPNELGAVFVYEVWIDETAHKNSLSLEATQTLISRAKPIITGMERIATLSLEGR